MSEEVVFVAVVRRKREICIFLAVIMLAAVVFFDGVKAAPFFAHIIQAQESTSSCTDASGGTYVGASGAELIHALLYGADSIAGKVVPCTEELLNGQSIENAAGIDGDRNGAEDRFLEALQFSILIFLKNPVFLSESTDLLVSRADGSGTTVLNYIHVQDGSK